MKDHNKLVAALGDARCIGINGLDCAGKTTVALGLLQQLQKAGENVTLLHVDDFNDMAVQNLIYSAYANGKFSDDLFQLYYEKSVDYEALANAIKVECSPSRIVMVEGVFLYKPQLSGLFDYRVFLDVEPEVARARFAQRRLDIGDKRPTSVFDDIWLPAFERYCWDVSPKSMADMVL